MKKVTFLVLFISVLTNSIIAQKLEQAITLFEKEQYKQASELLESISKSSKDYAKAQYYLGRITFNQEDYSESIDYLKEAVEYEESAENYTWLGNAYGRYTQNIGKLRQGVVAPKIKRNYEKALAIDPNKIDALDGLMEFYSQAPSMVGGSMDKAEEMAKRIVVLDKIRGYTALITVYQRQEKSDLAIEAFEQLAALDSRYNFNLGVFYQNNQKFEKAFNLYDKMYQDDPTNTLALYQIGKTSAMWGEKSSEGIQALEKYLTIEVRENQPSYAGANMRLAMIYENQGNLQKAAVLYKKAIDEDPSIELAIAGLKRVSK